MFLKQSSFSSVMLFSIFRESPWTRIHSNWQFSVAFMDIRNCNSMKINFQVGRVGLHCVYTGVYNSIWHNRTDLVSVWLLGLSSALISFKTKSIHCAVVIGMLIGVKLCSSALLLFWRTSSPDLKLCGNYIASSIRVVLFLLQFQYLASFYTKIHQRTSYTSDCVVLSFEYLYLVLQLVHY